jgi:DNA-binding NarL/FixJ family response regulator
VARPIEAPQQRDAMPETHETLAMDGERRARSGGSRGPHGSGEDHEDGISPLSKREREILAQVASGQTNADIAEALFFATKTVERHVATIVGKLGARNRAHAAALAVSQQIIDIESR